MKSTIKVLTIACIFYHRGILARSWVCLNLFVSVCPLVKLWLLWHFLEKMQSHDETIITSICLVFSCILQWVVTRTAYACTCTYTCVPVRTRVFRYTHVYLNKWMCMHACTCSCIYAYVPVRMYNVYLRVCTCMYSCVPHTQANVVPTLAHGWQLIFM